MSTATRQLSLARPRERLPIRLFCRCMIGITMADGVEEMICVVSSPDLLIRFGAANPLSATAHFCPDTTTLPPLPAEMIDMINSAAPHPQRDVDSKRTGRRCKP
jgi:hypothetical protein